MNSAAFQSLSSSPKPVGQREERFLAHTELLRPKAGEGGLISTRSATDVTNPGSSEVKKKIWILET